MTKNMEFFDTLPLELVALILDHLVTEDLVSCLQVSSTWRRVVGGFPGLWVQRCREYGIPERWIENQDPVIVFLAARGQRNLLRRSGNRLYQDIRNTSEEAVKGSTAPSPVQVVYAGNGVVVTTVFGPRPEDQQEQREKKSNRLRTESFTPYNDLKQRYKFEHLIVERLSETGRGVRDSVVVDLEKKWDWPVITRACSATDGSWVILKIRQGWIGNAWCKIVLPNSANESGASGSKFPNSVIISEHHPSIPYDWSCCSQCSTVALVKEKLSMRPPWEFGVDILSLDHDQQVNAYTVPILNYDQMRLSSDVRANVYFKAYFFCSESDGVPSSCKSHKLLLWRTNDHTITINTYTEEEGISREAEATFLPVPQGKTPELTTAWSHARMNVSSDFKLLGFLIARRLHLWSLESHEKLNTLHLDGIPGLRSLIMSLGHVYSLFGTLHEGGEVVLVVTITGEVVWRSEGFLKEGDEFGARPLQHVGIRHADWMNDVYKRIPNNVPFLLYASLNSPTYISGLGIADRI